MLSWQDEKQNDVVDEGKKVSEQVGRRSKIILVSHEGEKVSDPIIPCSFDRAQKRF